jgi:two-component system chemotaxis response regulator CheB
MTKEKIKILVTDDSAVTRKFLVALLSSDPDIEVIGTATNGAEAIAFIRKTKPDVITMDINMPVMDGFEATINIMSEIPIPIVIVSSEYSSSETAKKFKAFEVGAVSILPLPFGIGHVEYEASKKRFISTVKLMSEVKLIRRWTKSPNPAVKSYQNEEHLISEAFKAKESFIGIIAIGASAGGPIAVKDILDNISPDLSVPIIVVQHIDAEFTQGYADWLNFTSKIKVVIANDKEVMEPGKVYMAPGNHHIGVSDMNTILISKDVPERGLRPSVSFLFRSIRNVYHNNALCILLSGMGADGAIELKQLKDAGSITIAQDAESSLIHGMPGEAIKLGGASHILSPLQIVNFIKECNLILSK